MRKLLVAGNWKLNGSQQLLKQWLLDFNDGFDFDKSNCDVALCVPNVYLPLLKQIKPSSMLCGSQDVSSHSQGAYTGEVSAEMLADVGADLVLVGHSERRAYHNESDAKIAAKFQQAIDHALIPVLCVGESHEQRESNQTFAVIEKQLKAVIEKLTPDLADRFLIAYEPVWAIGTGLTASAEQAQEVHQFIRSQLAINDVTMARQIRLLYGGSCNGENAHELFSMPDVDGGLIGGASLTATDFMTICHQANSLLKNER